MVKNIYEQIFKDLAFEKKSQQPSQNNLQPPNKIEPPPQAWDEFGQPWDPNKKKKIFDSQAFSFMLQQLQESRRHEDYLKNFKKERTITPSPPVSTPESLFSRYERALLDPRFFSKLFGKPRNPLDVDDLTFLFDIDDPNSIFSESEKAKINDLINLFVNAGLDEDPLVASFLKNPGQKNRGLFGSVSSLPFQLHGVTYNRPDYRMNYAIPLLSQGVGNKFLKYLHSPGLNPEEVKPIDLYSLPDYADPRFLRSGQDSDHFRLLYNDIFFNLFKPESPYQPGNKNIKLKLNQEFGQSDPYRRYYGSILTSQGSPWLPLDIFAVPGFVPPPGLLQEYFKYLRNPKAPEFRLRIPGADVRPFNYDPQSHLDRWLFYNNLARRYFDQFNIKNLGSTSLPQKSSTPVNNTFFDFLMANRNNKRLYDELRDLYLSYFDHINYDMGGPFLGRIRPQSLHDPAFFRATERLSEILKILPALEATSPIFGVSPDLVRSSLAEYIRNDLLQPTEFKDGKPLDHGVFYVDLRKPPINYKPFRNLDELISYYKYVPKDFWTKPINYKEYLELERKDTPAQLGSGFNTDLLKEFDLKNSEVLQRLLERQMWSTFGIYANRPNWHAFKSAIRNAAEGSFRPYYPRLQFPGLPLMYSVGLSPFQFKHGDPKTRENMKKLISTLFADKMIELYRDSIPEPPRGLLSRKKPEYSNEVAPDNPEKIKNIKKKPKQELFDEIFMDVATIAATIREFFRRQEAYQNDILNLFNNYVYSVENLQNLKPLEKYPLSRYLDDYIAYLLSETAKKRARELGLDDHVVESILFEPRDPAFIKPMQDYLRAAKAEHPEEYQKLVNAVNALYNLDPLLRFYYLNEPLPAHSTQIPLQIPYQMDEILDDRALIKRVID
jgi:hypothetical protein